MKSKMMTKSAHPAKETEKTAPAAIMSLRTALFGGAALLILFAWLHLILALQIASTGRQIQISTEDLLRLKRENTAVVRDTAIAESEASMTARAKAIGYGPQAPVYLLLGQTVETTWTASGGSEARNHAGPVTGGHQGSALSEYLLDTTLYDTSAAQSEASDSESSSAKRAP